MKNEPLTNVEIRAWYKTEVAKIPELNEQWINDGVSLKTRARRAWQFRHNKRMEARAMMQDIEEVELLKARDKQKYGNPDGPDFGSLISGLKTIGLAENEVFEEIIKMSSRTDTEINKKLGV